MTLPPSRKKLVDDPLMAIPAQLLKLNLLIFVIVDQGVPNGLGSCPLLFPSGCRNARSGRSDSKTNRMAEETYAD